MSENKPTGQDPTVLSDEQQMFLEVYRAALEASAFKKADEFCRFCKLKGSFARGYRALAAENEKAIAVMRERSETGDVGEGVTPDVIERMIRIQQDVHSEVCRRMEEHYRNTWNESITDRAATGSGCLGVLVAVVLFISMLGASAVCFIRQVTLVSWN